MPIDLPRFCLNGLTIKAFNEVYYRWGQPSTSVVDYETFFYPLDAILEWNRMYGRNGFVQYQCVLPKDASEAGLLQLLSIISAAGHGSFLAVLKLFGRQDGILSFPMEGYTLALDFPVNAATLQLLPRLDAVVADHGGRIYLAKDARMPARLMRTGYPALNRFRAVRERYDPHCRFRSLLSDRLDL